MNERKELIERLRLDYTASNMALALMRQAADMLEADAVDCHLRMLRPKADGRPRWWRN